MQFVLKLDNLFNNVHTDALRILFLLRNTEAFLIVQRQKGLLIELLIGIEKNKKSEEGMHAE